jgi:hypothetical protein
MRLSEDSERKRKVAQLFGDISDIMLEEVDSLNDLCCKWTSLNVWQAVLSL